MGQRMIQISGNYVVIVSPIEEPFVTYDGYIYGPIY